MKVDAGSLIAGLIFSAIGLGALKYGRSESRPKLIVLGIALMAYPFVTPDGAWTWIVGAALTGLLFFGD